MQNVHVDLGSLATYKRAQLKYFSYLSIKTYVVGTLKRFFLAPKNLFISLPKHVL